ncbi:MAG: DUF2971 domain-containing protein [Sphaerochaeta associata]|uniref:DUF2971 domain-containing protein n=1 Tax=Sphaerochaeta associata TaxID=1129264 RepID=UPI002B216818|nr:DUF2971 domain-containing protein [Sphaerochaeta associata]MEA5106377.1 DUF2971 domain-containing protein [Sphaerochaeta associata]
MKDIDVVLKNQFKLFFSSASSDVPNSDVETFINSISFNSSYKIKDFSNLDKMSKLNSDIYNYNIRRYFRDFNKDIINTNKTFYLILFSESFEYQFFQLLTKTFPSAPFYHYTSLDALIKILNSNKIRFSSIASLNDRGELYYFDNIFDAQINNLKLNKQNLNVLKNSNLTYENDIISKFHYKTIESFNNRFLLSCSSLKDKLDQWRLYGDDGKGVCIELNGLEGSISDKNPLFDDFYIGRILYGDSFVKSFFKLQYNLLVNDNIYLSFNNLNIWKHFFKSDDWEGEKEIRIFNELISK